MAAGATNDPETAYRAGLILGQEMKAVGINWNLAPMLRIAQAGSNMPGDKSRPISMLPDVVGAYGASYIRGFQEKGVMATVKHFPGTSRHEDSGVDAHLALAHEKDTITDLDSYTWVAQRLAMQADPAAMMITHTLFDNIAESAGLPASVSPGMYALLRGRLGFKGLLTTDSLEMGALPEAGYPVDKASAAALAAGADVLLHQRNHEDHRRCLAEIERQITDGTIPLERLDEAVLRDLVFKSYYGLLDLEAKDPQLKRMPGVEERTKQSREDAARAITVLKNERGLLPLKQDKPTLVIEYGPAHGTTWMPGIAQPGQIRGLGDKLGADTYVLEHLDLSEDELEEIVEEAKGKTVIAITSEAKESPFQQRLIQALSDAVEDLIVIAMRGPYDIGAFPYIHTYVCSYGFNPAHMDALVKVLTGQVSPQGRLPVDIPDLFRAGSGLTW
jgi:beta-N-acetylhexosaminidase